MISKSNRTFVIYWNYVFEENLTAIALTEIMKHYVPSPIHLFRIIRNVIIVNAQAM